MLAPIEMKSQQASTAGPVADPRTSPSCTLADLGSGERAIVREVLGGDALARRLVDHGLWPGIEVLRVRHALGGDPILFVLHGYRLALRADEARRVQVERGGAA